MIGFLLFICLLLACAYAMAEIIFERDFPRHFAKYILLFGALLLVSICGLAQGIRYESNVTTSATNVPIGAQAPIYTYPFSKITVCAYPASPTSGAPCTNTITPYSDMGLQTPLSSNPFSADGQGKFGFWLASGTYSYSVTTPAGVYLGTYNISLGGAAGSGSVTSVSGTTANGLTVSVANPATTPSVSVAVDANHVLPVKTGSAGTYLDGTGNYSTPNTGITSFQGRSGTAAVLNTADVGGLGTLPNSTTGNAATASALDHTPTQCGSGYAPTGISATGAAVTCQAIGGSSGFPITIGSTPVSAGSSVSGLNGVSVNGVALATGGSPTLYLDQTGSYSTPPSSGGGVSGQTPGQIPIAATATTLASSIPTTTFPLVTAPTSQTITQGSVSGIQTTLKVNSLNDISNAAQYETGGSANGLTNAFAQLPNGGFVWAPATDPHYQRPAAAYGSYFRFLQVPTNSQAWSTIGGSFSHFHQNPGLNSIDNAFDGEFNGCNWSTNPIPGTISPYAMNCSNIISQFLAGYYPTNGVSQSQFSVNVNAASEAPGIYVGFGAEIFRDAFDDTFAIDLNETVQSSWRIGGSQGVGSSIATITEGSGYTGTVVSSVATSGASSLTLTPTAGRVHLGDPVADETTGVATYTASAFSGDTVTISGAAFTPSIACNITTAPAFTVPNTYSNALVSFQINCPSAPTAGQLMSLGVGGLNNLEPSVRLVTATLASGTTYNVSAYIYHSHLAGEAVNVGGLIGHLVESVNDTTNYGQRYLAPVLSNTATTITEGAQTGYSAATPIAQIRPILIAAGNSVKLYCGTETTSLVNPSTNAVDGAYLGVRDNNCTWTASDVVENTVNVSQAYDMHQDQIVSNNPNANGGNNSNIWQYLECRGVGCAAPRGNGISNFLRIDNNVNNPLYYPINGGTDGSITPPSLGVFFGTFQYGLVFGQGLAAGAAFNEGNYYSGVATANQFTNLFIHGSQGAMRWNGVTDGFEIGVPSASASTAMGTISGGLRVSGPIYSGLADAAHTACTQTNGLCTGSGATSVLLAPSATQAVVQPLGTTLSVNDFNKIVYSNGYSTVEQAVAACNAVYPCQIVLSSTLTTSTSGTYTIPLGVFMRGEAGGGLNIASGNTFSFANTEFYGPRAQFFSGAGTVVGLIGDVSVEWFGGKNDWYIPTGTGTDNTGPTQLAVNAINGFPIWGNGFGNVTFGSGLYEINGQVTITAPGVGIRGEGLNSTAIVMTTAGTVPFTLSNSGYNEISDMTIARQTHPNALTAAIHINNSPAVKLERLSIFDSSIGIYLNGDTAGGRGVISQTYISNGNVSGYTSADSVYGVFFDSSNGAPENTAELNEVEYSATGSAASAISYAYAVIGTNINDINLYDVQSSGASYGAYIKYNGSGSVDSASDIHFKHFTFDACTIACIYVDNANQGNPMITFDSGYLDSDTAGGFLADIESSQGVSILNTQAFSPQASGVNGLFFNNSLNCNISNNLFNTMKGSAYAIALTASTGCIVSGNNIYSNFAGFNLATGIALQSTSINNVVSGNSVGGQFNNGFVVDSTSQTNQWSTNACSGTFTNCYTGFTSQSTYFPAAIAMGSTTQTTTANTIKSLMPALAAGSGTVNQNYALIGKSASNGQALIFGFNENNNGTVGTNQASFGSIQMFGGLGAIQIAGSYVEMVSSLAVNTGTSAGTGQLGVGCATGVALCVNAASTFSVDTAGNTTTPHVIIAGTAPTMAAGSAAGTSPSCATVAGHNMAGVITCNTGTATTTGTLATITFNGTIATAPQGCTLMPRSAISAAAATSVYTTAPSTTTWTIGAASALNASSAYSWYYICE